MRASIVGLLFLGLTTLCYSQTENENMLIEVEVYAKNYNYLESVNSNDLTLNKVNVLERKVANFDVNSLNLPDNNFESCKVLFFIKDGVISASFDNKSNIIRTIEKFKNIDLPLSIKHSIVTKYPDHLITADEYLVRYHYKKGVTKKYKVLLENGDKQFWVKTDENGMIL